MDLNRQFFLHQIALMRAACAGGRRERDRHHAEADGIAERIGAFQDRLGACAAPLIPAHAL